MGVAGVTATHNLDDWHMAPWMIGLLTLFGKQRTLQTCAWFDSVGMVHKLAVDVRKHVRFGKAVWYPTTAEQKNMVGIRKALMMIKKKIGHAYASIHVLLISYVHKSKSGRRGIYGTRIPFIF